MAAQQTYDLFNYLFRNTAYPLIQHHLLGRRLMPNGQWSSSNLTLNDLDDYCLAHIFKFLTFRDLVRTRFVCRRLHHSVGEYLDTRKHFIYTCDLNGVQLQNGYYSFNWNAFEFALQHMPNLRSLAFEKCSVMKHTLATCSHDIFERICAHLYELKMLYITRSLAITPQTVSNLIASFPDLTHLSVNIFSEDILETIVNGFKHLKYLNLEESILYDYAPILKRIGPNIKTFIAPVDLKDQKLEILEALSEGHGKNLIRLELKVCIHDLIADVEFFNKIGQGLKHLKWFKCELRCSNRETTRNMTASDEDDQSPRHTSLELNQHSMASICSSHYEHRHVNLIRGLSALKHLRVLILQEKDYFDVENRCTILDDESMLEIFQCCSKLEMLTISCAIRRNKRNYHRYEFDSKENVQEVNRILNQIFNENRSSQTNLKTAQGRDVRLAKKFPIFDRSESMFGDMFECESDNEERSLDSGISDIQYPHIISDSCLANIDTHLPKLRILQLRGIRLGLKSMEAIVNLKKLECLRLDSITFNTNESDVNDHFTEFISQMATANLKSKTNIRITNIPL